jgi:hypothetical protein
MMSCTTSAAWSHPISSPAILNMVSIVVPSYWIVSPL